MQIIVRELGILLSGGFYHLGEELLPIVQILPIVQEASSVIVRRRLVGCWRNFFQILETRYSWLISVK